jgi:hypothetical protein
MPVTPSGLTPVNSVDLSDDDILVIEENSAGSDNVKGITLGQIAAYVLAQIDPDPDFEDEEATLTVSTVYTFPHGIGAIPNRVECFLECVTADANWSVGDQLDLPPRDSVSSAIYNFQVARNATNIIVAQGQSGIATLNGTTAAGAVLTLSRWKLVVRAWA